MLYGKWRPRGFDEVVGQDHIVTTLRNGLKTGQMAHAYLFSGPRGTGKTTTARILARALNCTNSSSGEPCNACPSCEAISRGNALDLIEMDAASNRGIDDVRELREKIAFAPSDLMKKVYLLDEVHMLTDGAFNALLKTLEEPPPHAVFILATTELQKVPDTIKSRCQRYDFHRIPNDALVGRLRFICEQEGYKVTDEGLLIISVQSRGGARDAINLLEQVISRYGVTPSTGEVIAGLGLVRDERSELLVQALLDEDLAAALDLTRAVADDGIDLTRFAKATVDILREMLPQVLRHAVNPELGYTELVQKAIDRGPAGIPTVVSAIQELAKADFRLDPGNPVPLEVACASVILGPVAAPAVAAPAGRPQEAAGPPRAQSRPPAAPGSRPAPAGPDRPLTPDERFVKDLYGRCSMANMRLGAWLNGGWEVISMDGDTLELGFYRPVHMEKVDTDCRTLVEQQAEEILGRKVTLKVRLIEDKQQARRAPRSGHLVEVAKSIPGAVPVGKD